MVDDLRASLGLLQFAPVGGSIAERFRVNALRPAVVEGARIYTFAELEQRARVVARILDSAGVEPGVVCGLTGRSSVELVAALVALILRGAVFVLLAPDLPLHRKQIMLERAGAEHVCSTDAETDSEGLTGMIRLPHSAPGVFSAVEGEWTTHVPDPDDPAYVFFTSGTSGEPKPIFGRHKSLSHFLAWQAATFNLGLGDRFSNLISLSFDAVMRDLLLPLTVGAAICVPPTWQNEPAKVLPWLQATGVTVVHAVPTLARLWLAAAEPGLCLPELRFLFLSGEPLMSSLVEAWRERLSPDANVVNFYGPTETTLIKSYYVVPKSPRLGAQPIGRPLPQTQIVVMSPEGKLCPPKEQGELVIRTPYRSLGYARTDGEALCFRLNPWSADESDLLYRTGDLGWRQEDGTLEICGRIDDQIKIHGVRVEPAEVRAVIESLPGIHQCEVTARELGGAMRLVAYVAAPQGGDLDLAAVRQALRERLPAALVPARIVVVERFPIGPTGKVDRRKLAEIPLRSETSEDDALAPVEAQLAALWCAILCIPRVGRGDDFFALGGDSLSALELVVAARREGLELTAELLRRHSTLADLASAVSAAKTPRGIEPILRRSNRELPLLPTQLDILSLPDPASFTMTPKAVLVSGSLSASLVGRAIQTMLERHEALRARFVRTEAGWRQEILECADLLSAPDELHLGVLALAKRPSALAKRVEELAIFDLETPPLIRTLLVHGDPGADATLVVIIHHLVADGWSEKRLQEELLEALRQLEVGATVALPSLRSSTVLEWANHLRIEAVSDGLKEHLRYWSDCVEPEIQLQGETKSPYENPGQVVWSLDAGACSPGSVGGTELILERGSFELDPLQTKRLLATLQRVPGAQAIDLFLAAVLGTLRHQVGRSRWWIELAHHGRDAVSFDLSETIGCLYWVYPAQLSLTETEPLASIATLARERRAVPGAGLPYVLGRWLSEDTARRRSLARITPLVGVNYVGRVSASLSLSPTGFQPLEVAEAGVGAALARNLTTPLKFFFYWRGDELAGHVWRDPRLLPNSGLPVLTARLANELVALGTGASDKVKA